MKTHKMDRNVDEAGRESFPASDPSASSPGKAHPNKHDMKEKNRAQKERKGDGNCC